jgi:hypothetical protein
VGDGKTLWKIAKRHEAQAATPRRSIEDVSCPCCAEKDAAVARLREEVETYHTMTRKAIEAWAGEFQSGGKYHSALLLGSSTIVDGGAWLMSELDAARARVQRLEAAMTAARVALGCWQTTAHERVADADQILMRAALAAQEADRA